MQLVTGGTGLVGAHLLFRLTEREQILRASFRSEKRIQKVRELFHWLDPDTAEHRLSLIQWQSCDLLDITAVEELCEGVTEIFHCAAMVSFHPADKWKLLEQNPRMTALLVNQALHQGVEQFNYVSSVAALGRPPQGEEGQPIDEQNIWKDDPDHSVYAQSKYLAEMEVWRGMEEGLNAAMVNPGIILGPGFPDEGSSSIFGLVQRGFRYYTPGLNGFVDVRDVVEGLLKISEKRLHQERFILVADSIAYRWLFSRIAEALHKKLPDKAAKAWMIQLIRRVHWLREKLGGRKATISRETAASAVRISRYKNRKSIEQLALQYKPLRETVEWVCSSMRA